MNSFDKQPDLLPESEIERSVIWRKLIVRILSLILVLAFIPLAFSGVLRLMRLPSLGFLIESRELSQDPQISSFKEAVVAIRVDNRRGTGFNIDPAGLIITNHHILEDDETAEVRWQDGQSELASLLLSWPLSDLAILSVQQENLPYLELETKVLPDPGDEVYMIGNPLGFFQVANKAEFLGLAFIAGREMPVIRIRGPVYQGNSGSPVINSEGKVIGVVFARSEATGEESDRSTGYAITSAEIEKIIKAVQIENLP